MSLPKHSLLGDRCYRGLIVHQQRYWPSDSNKRYIPNKYHRKQRIYNQENAYSWDSFYRILHTQKKTKIKTNKQTNEQTNKKKRQKNNVKDKKETN